MLCGVLQVQAMQGVMKLIDQKRTLAERCLHAVSCHGQWTAPHNEKIINNIQLGDC